MKKQKRLSVELTLSWEFDEKDWKELQQHQNDLKENQKIVLGEDLINTLFSLNELDYPSLKDFKVINK
jgi:S-adenosylmethionine:tRNA-ribosyltransferase-isomerase (queuine synthetase)